MNLTSEIKYFIEEHEKDDTRTLALQSGRYPNIDMPFAIQQIAGRQIAKTKIPTWYASDEIIYPKHISLEQCSSEKTALYKASLYKGSSMADLTGGFGIDFSFISRNFELATYIEQQKELTQIAVHNFNVLGLHNVRIENIDAINYLETMQPVDLIYIDPARRSTSGKKTILIQDCTPNIIDIEGILKEKAEQTMIKLSPMLDISLALKTMQNISDVHIISYNNECKELLFIKKESTNRTKLHCINITDNKTDVLIFTKEEEEQIGVKYVSELGKYLYEPNSSIIKAGAYKSIAKEFDLAKLHTNSHLYTSDQLFINFPGRRFEIAASSSLNKKELKDHLYGLSKANITVRNFPLSVEELRKRTNLKDGGDTYIFATTLNNDKKVLIFCKKTL